MLKMGVQKMLKTTIVTLTLSGTYQAVLPTTIKTYAMIQAKAPSGGFTYKMNGSTGYMSVSENEYLQHPIVAPDERQACEDVITVAGSGNVNFEIQYFSEG